MWTRASRSAGVPSRRRGRSRIQGWTLVRARFPRLNSFLLDRRENFLRDIHLAPAPVTERRDDASLDEQLDRLACGGIGHAQAFLGAQHGDERIHHQVVKQRRGARFVLERVAVALADVDELRRLLYRLARDALHPGEEIADPCVPVAVRAHALQKLVIVLAVLVDVVRKVKQRLREPAALDEEKGDEQPADAAVAVEEGMDRLELLVHQRALDEIRHLVAAVDELLPSIEA